MADERSPVVEHLTTVIATERPDGMISLSRIDGTIIGPRSIARPEALVHPEDPRSAPERPVDELADLRARHATVLAYLDQRAGTPGAGPSVPADLIRAMLVGDLP